MVLWSWQTKKVIMYEKKYLLIIIIPGMIIGLMIRLFLSIFIFLFIAQYIYPEIWGSHSLGNDIYLLDGDGANRGVIVFTDKEDLCGNTSYGGSTIIPLRDIGYNDSTGYDYVVNTSYDENWIIVQTQYYGTQNYRYYIISKDFDPEKMFGKYKMTNKDSLAGKSYKTNYDVFIDRNIRVFSDSTEFAAVCKEDKIKLNFK